MAETPTPQGDPVPLFTSGGRKITRQAWRYADGEIWQQHTAIQGPVVAVLPIRDNDGIPEVLLVRQFRPAVPDWVEEAVAGKIDPEDHDAPDFAEHAARRELAEETGLHAGRLVRVGTAHVSPGWTNEHVVMFLAFDLTETGQDRAPWDAANVEPRWYPLEVCLDAIGRGEINDLKTIALLGIAERELAKKPNPQPTVASVAARAEQLYAELRTLPVEQRGAAMKAFALAEPPGVKHFAVYTRDTLESPASTTSLLAEMYREAECAEATAMWQRWHSADQADGGEAQ